jgi:hypothetical protein
LVISDGETCLRQASTAKIVRQKLEEASRYSEEDGCWARLKSFAIV